MTQKALVVPAIGSPLILTTRPIPVPKGTQLLVKVLIAGLNPHDAKSQSSGLFISKSLPTPLGIDIVGTVVETGPDTKAFKKGDKVFTFTNPREPDHAGTQEYAILDSELSSLIPSFPGLSDHDFATLTLNPMTAFWGMFRPQGLGIPPPAPFHGHDPTFNYSSKSIAVIGGGSTVAKYVIAWAKYAGFGIILTTATKTPQSVKQLEGWGATHILDRKLPTSELQAQVRGIVGDELVYVYDAVNYGQAVSIGASFLSPSKPGTLVTICGGDFDASVVPGLSPEFKRNQVMAALAAAGEDKELGKSYWKHLCGLIEKGVLRPTPYEEIIGLDVGKVNEVLRGYNEGRAVVKPQLRIG